MWQRYNIVFNLPNFIQKNFLTFFLRKKTYLCAMQLEVTIYGGKTYWGYVNHRSLQTYVGEMPMSDRTTNALVGLEEALKYAVSGYYKNATIYVTNSEVLHYVHDTTEGCLSKHQDILNRIFSLIKKHQEKKETLNIFNSNQKDATKYIDKIRRRFFEYKDRVAEIKRNKKKAQRRNRKRGKYQ